MRRGSTLVIATRNPHKVAEIRSLLRDVPVELRALGADVAEAEETGATFQENARAKALHYAAATGLPCIAEDSGLAIDALGGAPGVHSARYDGDRYADKFRTIYAALDARGAAGSTARFVCALAVADADRIVFETVGTVEGRIAREPRGAAGFGYDPIFFYPPYGRTLAEVTADEKAAVSHRGQAFRALAAFLARAEGA